MLVLVILLLLNTLPMSQPHDSLSFYDDSNLNDKPRMVVFICFGLALGAITRSIVKRLNITLPYPVLLLIFGGMLGLICRYTETLGKYVRVAHSPPKYLLMIFIPILIYKPALCIDAHTFFRSWLQIAIISMPVLLIATSFLSLIIMVIAPITITYAEGFLFGIVCAPIYPLEVISLFNEIGQISKHITVLLEGEAITGISITIIIFHILIGIAEGHVSSWYQILFIFLRYIVGGILFGYILGRISCCIISALYNDSVNVLTTTLVFTYIGYYICEEILYVSGVLCIIILGIMASVERTSLKPEVELFLMEFWEILTYIANSVMFLIAGVLITEYVIENFQIKAIALAFVTYIVANVGRFLGFILMAPILSRIGYGLTFSHLTLAVWGGLRGVITLCLGVILFRHPTLHDFGDFALIHSCSLVFLTLLINATTMPLVLRILGLSEISLARKANMNNCVRHVSSRRERTIAMLKMDRFLSDANWAIVSSATVLVHPYKININDLEDEDEFYLGYKIATCPDCQKEVPHEPTVKEMAEMTREARMRILKAKKISYARQYENGMLSKESIRILRQATEIAMDTPEALIEIDGLHKLFRKQGVIHYLRRQLLHFFFEKSENVIKPPRKYWRRICYHIIMHPAFDIVINLLIVLNVIQISIDIGLSQESRQQYSNIMKAFNIFFFIVYLLEFIFKIYGFSWIYVCKHGFRTYFTSYWNIFDFCILLAASVDIIIDHLGWFIRGDASYQSGTSKVAQTTKYIRIVRLIRLLRLCKPAYPRLLRYCDSKIDGHMAFAYDVGKGFVSGEEEVTEMLNYMIDNKVIREDMRVRMEADRLAITKELGMIQKDRPWIAITVKTRQAIRATLNSMLDAIVELKISGWVDDVELYKLLESLENRLNYVRNIKSVQPSPPKEIFKEVSWMCGDEEITTFLYEHVMTKVFDAGDRLCTDDEMADGIYIVVTGLFKLSYIPRKHVLEQLALYGALPVRDNITSTRFEDRVEDYIVSGNCIGELSALTHRPYNCTITADTPSQVYVLTHEVLQQAIAKSLDPVNGLEPRMWKTLCARLALSILMEVPAYQSQTQEQIRYHLERAFVPNLKNYKIFVVNDMIEDILLIEGLIVDFNTRDLYTGPCYIPRTVQKLVLPRSSHMTVVTKVETKLLIIPTKDVDEYEIMEREEDISEMISLTSSKCLQHVIQSRNSKQRKRKKKTVFGLSQRKVKYGSSRASIGYSRSRASSMTDETELQSFTMSMTLLNEQNGNKSNTESESLFTVQSAQENVSENKKTTFEKNEVQNNQKDIKRKSLSNGENAAAKQANNATTNKKYPSPKNEKEIFSEIVSNKSDSSHQASQNRIKLSPLHENNQNSQFRRTSSQLSKDLQGSQNQPDFSSLSKSGTQNQKSFNQLNPENKNQKRSSYSNENNQEPQKQRRSSYLSGNDQQSQTQGTSRFKEHNGEKVNQRKSSILHTNDQEPQNQRRPSRLNKNERESQDSSKSSNLNAGEQELLNRRSSHLRRNDETSQNQRRPSHLNTNEMESQDNRRSSNLDASEQELLDRWSSHLRRNDESSQNQRRSSSFSEHHRRL